MVSHKLRLRFITQLKSVKCHLEFYQLYWWGVSFLFQDNQLLPNVAVSRSACLSVCHNELHSWMQPISSPGQRVGREEGIQGMKSSREMYLAVCDTLCV